MNKPTKFITADFYIQTILGILIIAQPLLTDAIKFFLPIGLWQVISALVLLIFFRNKVRIFHILLILIWLGLVGFLNYYGTIGLETLTSIAYAIPLILSILYYFLTAKEYWTILGILKK